MINVLLADAVYWIHITLVIVSIFGVIIVPDNYLKYALLLTPLIILDWNSPDGQCVLTRIEATLRGNWNSKTADEAGGNEFFRPILNKVLRVFGLNVSRSQASKINYSMFVIGWIAMYIKFLRTKPIC